MKHELLKKEKSQLQITITIPPAEYQKDLEKAALRLSKRAAIKGFRPGKAPYDIVKQQMGAGAIMQEAAQTIVQRNFFAVVKEENLDTMGLPEIKLEKMAPDNDLVFVATVALLPKVTLADLSKINVKKESTKIDDEKINHSLESLKKMQPKEVLKNAAAEKEDKMVIDMDMFIDKVPVEGGQAKGHQVYLSEDHYIPGLAEQLLGLKKDDTKEFNLKFPADHYQKHLANKPVDFKIKVGEVYKLEYPELNDEFAKTLGQESMGKLKELLMANLQKDAEQKESQRIESAILEGLIEKSGFEELPQVLVDAEKRKMFAELKHDLDRRGITFEKYLGDIKKTEEQIFNDFTIGATKRAKAALISRQVAKDNHIEVSKEEIEAEVEMIKKTYKEEEGIEEKLKKPEVIDTLTATVVNRKVVEFLKGKVLAGK